MTYPVMKFWPVGVSAMVTGSPGTIERLTPTVSCSAPCAFDAIGNTGIMRTVEDVVTIAPSVTVQALPVNGAPDAVVQPSNFTGSPVSPSNIWIVCSRSSRLETCGSSVGYAYIMHPALFASAASRSLCASSHDRPGASDAGRAVQPCRTDATAQPASFPCGFLQSRPAYAFARSACRSDAARGRAAGPADAPGRPAGR